jgi:uncharacterized membrane protein YkvA (DUF1232 family)
MKNLKENKNFKKALENTENIIEDKNRVDSILQKAIKKLTNVKNKSKEFKDNLGVAISLVKDWTMGNYKEVPKRTIMYLIAALIYFIMPIDIIPDFIFKFGFLDDIAVLNFVLSSFVEDIENYKNYKELEKQKTKNSKEEDNKKTP